MKTMISFQCDSVEESRAVIDAVAAIGKEPHACSKAYVEPAQITSEAVVRTNENPGPSAIGKIGTNTTEQLLGMLKDGHQPPEKWSEHMKLLWSRNIVKFDGKEYYL